MEKRVTNIDQLKAAKVAGISILLMTIAAVVSNDIAIGSLVVPDNAAETLNNIMASKMLFRIGVFGWLIILICDMFAAWGLYIFLRPVNKNLSMMMAWSRLIYVAILGSSLMNLIDVLSLISGAEYLSIMGTEQLQTAVLFYSNAFQNTWSMGLVVFGIHVLFLGYLIIKSGFSPKILGILLILAFIGYTIINVSNLLFPQYEQIMVYIGWVFLIPMISEVALGIWLLIIGFKKTNDGNKK